MEGGDYHEKRSELLMPPIQESYGSSNSGPRTYNEDTIYSPQGFCLAYTETGRLENILLRREDVEKIHQEVIRLKNQGLLGGVDVVCDGMGGHGNGDMASSIATYFFVREIVNAVKRTEGNLSPKDIRDAVFFAHLVIQSYNNKNRSDAGTTFVAQVTGKDGRTFIVSVGHSRAYLVNKNGSILRLTNDQSFFELLLSKNITLSPIAVLAHERRNIITSSLGNQTLKPEDIFVSEYRFKPGDRLILCSDGVWEGIDPGDPTTQKKLATIDNSFRDNLIKGVSREAAINIAYGEMFRLILEGKIGGTPQELAEHLTREKVGKNSQDNVSAVVVQINNPALSQELHQSPPSPNEKKLSLTPGSLVAVKRSNGIIDYNWAIAKIDQAKKSVTVVKPISDGSGDRLVKEIPLDELYQLNQLPEGVSKIDQAQSIHELCLILCQYYPEIQGSGVTYSAKELVELIQAVEEGRENVNVITRTYGLREKVVKLLAKLNK